MSLIFFYTKMQKIESFSVFRRTSSIHYKSKEFKVAGLNSSLLVPDLSMRKKQKNLVANELKKSISMKSQAIPFRNEKFNICKIFESKISEKLKLINPNDEKKVLMVYLEILEKIISIDPYKPVLEKIKEKIYQALNKDFPFKGNPENKQLEVYTQEIFHLKSMVAEYKNHKISLETKLEKLSLENIQLLNENSKLLEEKSL